MSHRTPQARVRSVVYDHLFCTMPAISVIKNAMAMLALAASAGAAGCAAGGSKASPGDTTDAAAASAGDTTALRGGNLVAGVDRPIAEIVRDRLTGANNGLEVQRLTVLDPSQTAIDLLAEHAQGCAGSAEVCARLRQNGIRLVRIPAQHVPAITEALGGATATRVEWHGQAYDWRPLCQRLVDGGAAVAIDGRVRRFERGEFTMLMRGWTMMMEDGPYIHIEMLPLHRVPRSGSLRLLAPEQPQQQGEAIPSLALDLELQAGFAYVLVSVPPTLGIPAFDTPAPPSPNLSPAFLASRAPEASLQAPAAPAETPDVPAITAAPARIGPGADDAIGPDVGSPRTLGEVLLPAMNAPPTREIIVLVPKLPDELFPPIYESDLATLQRPRASP